MLGLNIVIVVSDYPGPNTLTVSDKLALEAAQQGLVASFEISTDDTARALHFCVAGLVGQNLRKTEGTLYVLLVKTEEEDSRPPVKLEESQIESRGGYGEQGEDGEHDAPAQARSKRTKLGGGT